MLGHLVYLENPGAEARSAPWARAIPPLVTGRGSFIRVFLADFNQDGRPEIVAANKGTQNPGPDATEPQPISWFELRGDPLHPASWVEHELARVPWPINSQPVDLDGDGDLDVLGGSVAESRILWFENVTDGDIRFRAHGIRIDGTSIPAADRPPGDEDTDRALVTGFNVDFADLNGDGRLDILLAEDFRYLVWLEQP
ncbi:MAG: VCBS repeat-containing protein [Gemmatimonadota bacterium]|nr:VCBS repeat-containing protein [Gemmatimonadota bacterium]MDE2866039.1 VCBS repeat-containing protein [Gemmatimonadota bacterium]